MIKEPIQRDKYDLLAIEQAQKKRERRNEKRKNMLNNAKEDTTRKGMR